MTKRMQFTHWVCFLIRKLTCWNSYVWLCPDCTRNPVKNHISPLELLTEKHYSVVMLHCQNAYEASWKVASKKNNIKCSLRQQGSTGKSTTVYFAGGRHDFSTIEGKWLATFQDVHATCLIYHMIFRQIKYHSNINEYIFLSPYRLWIIIIVFVKNRIRSQ